MTTFLLLISLLLNGIAIFSIIVLFTRQNRFLEVEKNQEKMMKDMEEVISSYLYEMKEENEMFLRRFQQTNLANSQVQKPKKDSVLHPQEISNDQPLQAQKTVEEWTEKTVGAMKRQAVQAYQSASIDGKGKEKGIGNEEVKLEELVPEVTDQADFEKSPDDLGDSSTFVSPEEIYRNIFFNQVIILQKQGLTIEEIAKKLNKGKTEIELLLKFAQNHKD